MPSASSWRSRWRRLNGAAVNREGEKAGLPLSRSVCLQKCHVSLALCYRRRIKDGRDRLVMNRTLRAAPSVESNRIGSDGRRSVPEARRN